jgi:hypothetical protein
MGYHIEGRRWFQRTYGNTYHTTRIYRDGDLVATLGPTYGYGDHYLQTAAEWLRANGEPAAEGHTLWMRETLGASYGVSDVSRRKDL